MSKCAIRVDNLGKMYLIGGPQERYRTIREVLTHSVATPFRRMRDLLSGKSASGLKEEMWALKDVAFEVQHGEVVGIIGRNGAGKSTLLKILSRITDPTTGYADIYGRVGALLEVGTGFHPELTGRENVYLNGAILGMSRRDITRKFDEIVTFAGVEKYVDTPVKHYSSGMALRLGFSVAAHLEPDILVVDEVLAVGDAEFQKKCLGKMSDVASEGRTVLFVSHNMASVRALCTKAFLLEHGGLAYTGEVAAVMQRYQESAAHAQAPQGSAKGKAVEFANIQINEQPVRTIDSTQPCRISWDLRLNKRLSAFVLYCIITDSDNQIVIHSPIDSLYAGLSVEAGTYRMSIQYPALWLRPGMYALQLKLIADQSGDSRFLSDSEYLDVTGNTEARALYGYLVPDIQWTVKEAG